MANPAPESPLLGILSALFDHGPDTWHALHLCEQWPLEYNEQHLKTPRKKPDYLMLARIITYEHDSTRALAEQRFTADEQAAIVKNHPRLLTPKERDLLISSGKRRNRQQVDPLLERIRSAWEEQQARRRAHHERLSHELRTFLGKETGREQWLRDRVRRLRAKGLLPNTPPPPFAGKLWRNRAELLEDHAKELQAKARELRARDRRARALRDRPESAKTT